MTNLYDAEYFRKITQEESLFAERLANYLEPIFNEQDRYPKVFDFGCGPGLYSSALRFVGINCTGFDSSDAIPTLPYIKSHDLTKPINDKADYGICLEVLEHIPEEYADTVVDNICAAVPWLLLSAAHPGQGGVGHVNCQPKSYWLNKFCKRGYYYCPEETDQMIIHIRQGMYMGWFTMNAMILRKSI